MKTDLYALTKEDWNTYFPVELVTYNTEWPVIYQQEKKTLLGQLGEKIILRIEHFGSTAIPKIKAKPYIDIIIEIESELLFNETIIEKMSEIGYTHFKVPARENIDAYMSFGKGYDLKEKKQIYHIHMCPKENYMWTQLAFRDYLIANPDRADAYESLKVNSATQHKNDRGAYVLSKTDFIKETLELMNGFPERQS
jgi:GrpB-like predicted nucleotidyltransferase (UPF0157 family)